MNAARACSSDSALRACSSACGAVLRRHQALNLKLLLGRERQELVGRLRAPAGLPTAPCDAVTSAASVRVGLDVLRDLRLNDQGLLEGLHRVLPALMRIGDELVGASTAALYCCG